MHSSASLLTVCHGQSQNIIETELYSSELYINYQLLCTDYYLFITYFPLHVSSLNAHLQEDTIVYMQHMVPSRWPVGTQIE